MFILGAIASRSAAPACAGSGIQPCHTFDVLTISIDEHVLRQALGNELSTTPDNSNGEHTFTVTHPFHPFSGRIFPLLAQRFAWGEERVFFADPQTQQTRSLPLAWTSLAPPDPFLIVADGNTVLRLQDLQQLAQFLRQKSAYTQEDR